MNIITTVRIKETTVNGQPVTSVSICGRHGHFVDSFHGITRAMAWATDVLVAYFGHTYTEAQHTVRAGMEQHIVSVAS